MTDNRPARSSATTQITVVFAKWLGQRSTCTGRPRRLATIAACASISALLNANAYDAGIDPMNSAAPGGEGFADSAGEAMLHGERLPVA